VVKPGDDDTLTRDTWEAEVFLMRKFETETIRIVVPVVGEADDDDIKSFVAAINLGMRKHFAGKVDHIRSTVVEAQLDGLAAVRSLFLYDAVPGGSGYLRQLAEHPDSMRTVVERSVHALRTCACVDEGKSGCFRCVKSYRTQFGPGDPDRDTALQMMENILANWSHLARTDAGIDTRIRDFLVESKLEYRFLETLVARFGQGCITPQILEGGRKGFLLKITEGQRTHFWNIETQIQIDKRFRDVPKKRVDFLFTPVGGLKAKPIVVEMDGLKYHADTVAKDLETRLLLIRSGYVRAWTLGWHDLETNASGHGPNPLAEERLGAAHAGVMARLLASPAMSDLQSDIAVLQNGTSLEGLFRHLSRPISDLIAPASVLTRTIVGPGRKIDELPRISALTDDGRNFLEEAELFGHVVDRNLDVYLAVKKTSPQHWRDKIDDCRVLLRGTLPDVAGDPLATAGYSDAWRGLWRLVNLLQEIPGFHIEFEGLDTLTAPDLTTVGAGPKDGAWLEVLSLVDEGFRPLIEALQAADALVPDMVGADLIQDGEVVGMIEIGWSNIRLAVCEDAFEASEWDLISFNADKGQSVTQIAALILQKIEGLKP
jgi:DEAD/DEAH box helicase domain-containing protein